MCKTSPNSGEVCLCMHIIFQKTVTTFNPVNIDPVLSGFLKLPVREYLFI